MPTYPQDKNREETRIVPFSKEIYIEHSDFMEEAARQIFPPGPGARGAPAWALTMSPAPTMSRMSEGNVVEVICTYDPESRAATRQTAAK